MSKRAGVPYRSGRSEGFIKAKCANAQEFVVGGYSPSTVHPKAVGALVAGYYDGSQLVYAGRIGTGYTQATARELWERLHPLEIGKPSFDAIPAQERRRRDVKWVEPKLVIEAQFRGWTGDLLLRQAAFKGVREDKPGREVVREMQTAIDKDHLPAHNASGRIAAEATKPMTRKSKRIGKVAKEPKTAKHSSNDGEVRFTHPDRVYWADAGVTKQDLADYYRDVWEFMVPHVADRPLALVRCPEGAGGRVLLPEARGGRDRARAAPFRHRQQEAPGDRDRKSRRGALAGAGGRT